MPNSDYCLLVDDDEFMTYVMSRILQRVGIATEIETASDGLDAIEKIDALGMPRLILLDLRMPRMDGFGFLEHCRAAGLDEAVIVVATSSVLPEDRERAMDYSFVIEVLEKPPTRDSFLQLLEVHPQLGALFPAASENAERIGV